MAGQDQLELGRRESFAARNRTKQRSDVRNILLHLQKDAWLDSRIDNALAIARAGSAHLTCLHVTPGEAYVAFDGLGGVFVMGDVIKAIEEEESELRSRIEERLRGEDVSWDYRQVTGDAASEIIAYAALFDLVVTGRTPRRTDFVGSAIGLLGDLICHSRTPLLIPAEGKLCDPNGAAMIAWDGSYEAANAVRAAIGLLKTASDVQVVRVEEKEEKFPSARLLEYLSRHDIRAELSVEQAGPEAGDPYIVSGILMEKARARNAYLIMGGYNHSRAREFIFGGVTRTLLSGSAVPLVIAR